MPGPLIEAEVGDTVVVHFRNKLQAPVTMHPHGIFYANEMDGAYKGKLTDPGGFVQRNRTFTYVWEAQEGTEGTWLYHDHGPMDPLPVFKGLFGPLVIRKPGEARPDREFFLAFHTWDPSITGLQGTYYCVNGKAYAGNTPTLEAKVGAAGRASTSTASTTSSTPSTCTATAGREPDGRIVDNKTFGPADSFSVRVRRGQPGALVLPLPRLPAPAPGDERLVPRLLGARRGARSLLPRLRLAGAAAAAPTRASRSPTTPGRNQQVHVDLGEKVTWDWLGPDLAHSVTGISANDLQLGLRPRHRRPRPPRRRQPTRCSSTSRATYFFQCKLHAFVRGEVIVSDVPGNPNSDPGPQPPLNVDIEAADAGLGRRCPSSRRNGHDGLGFSAQISERGTLDAEYYRFNSKGKRVYNGFETWKAFIGINHLRLGARGKHFRARPGRYLAVLRATDEAANESKPLRKRFTIGG